MPTFVNFAVPIIPSSIDYLINYLVIAFVAQVVIMT